MHRASRLRLRHRDVAAYTRARGLASAEDRRVHVFTNEHFKGTYVDRLEGESPNDRNDRAIRVAAKWYADHIQEAVSGDMSAADSDATPRVVLLTNDVDNRTKATAEGLYSVSLRDYVRYDLKSPELEDLLPISASEAAAADAADNSDGAAAAPGTEGDDDDADDAAAGAASAGSAGVGGAAGAPKHKLYLTPSVVQAGLRSGALLQGARVAAHVLKIYPFPYFLPRLQRLI